MGTGEEIMHLWYDGLDTIEYLLEWLVRLTGLTKDSEPSFDGAKECKKKRKS